MAKRKTVAVLKRQDSTRTSLNRWICMSCTSCWHVRPVVDPAKAQRKKAEVLFISEVHGPWLLTALSVPAAVESREHVNGPPGAHPCNRYCTAPGYTRSKRRHSAVFGHIARND